MKTKTTYAWPIVALHWLMSVSFIAMLASGLIMVQENLLPDQMRWTFYGLHKASGIVLLCAFIVRLAMRLKFGMPSWPKSMPKFDKVAAHWGHKILYVLMLIIPLTGWLMSSYAQYKPNIDMFGLFKWPHFPVEKNHDIADMLSGLHEFFAFVLIGVVMLHVAAVVKHFVVDKENVLKRMWFGK